MKVKKIDVGVDKVSIFLLGENKWGKTTLFADTVIEKFGDPECGCMLAIGGENPATMLDYVGVEQIDSYQDFFQAVKDLINRAESYEKVKMVAIDTVDELIPMLEKRVIDETNKQRQQEAREKGRAFTPIKSINGVGFNQGRVEAARLLVDSITALRKAGFGVWCIGHSAKKTLTSRYGTESGDVTYERLKSSLARNYDESLRNIMDMTLTGTIEFEDYDERITKDFGGNQKAIRTLNSIGTRYLYFRETPFVDASCYFAMGAVPEKLVFDGSDNSKTFIEVIEEGQRLSSFKNRKAVGVKAEKEKEEKQAQLLKEIEESAKENEKTEKAESKQESGPELEISEPEKTETSEIDVEAIKEEINTKYAKAKKDIKSKVKDLINGRSIEECEPEVLKEILEVLA